MKSNLLTPMLFAAALAATARGDIKIPYQESIDLDNIKSVEIVFFAGHAQILGDDQKTIDLQIEQIAKTSDQEEGEEWVSEIERTIEVRGDTLHIEFTHPDNRASSWFGFSTGNKCYLNASLSLPSHLDIKLKTGGGNVDASHLSGEMDIRTSGGNLKFEDISGRLTGNTSGGNIYALRLDGLTNLRTSGGHINVDTARSHLNLHTSGGNITVHRISAPVSAKTSGGNIRADFTADFSEDSEFRTSGGNITAKLPSDHAFDLKASTSGGGVRLNSGFPFEGEKKKSSAEGRINGGGPKLELRTSGGNIDISS